MPRIRVLIVDDAVVIRRIISSVLEEDPEIEVVGTASNGQIALERVTQLNPDLITMDVEMPVMDGLKAVLEIRKTHKKLPIIMFSTLTERGAKTTLEALTSGANDYITKPGNIGSINEGLACLKADLLPKIKALCGHISLPISKPLIPRRKQHNSAYSNRIKNKPTVLCIGSSTGGPNALADLFNAMKQAPNVPILMVQHMPPIFTKLLAERLSKISPIKCVEAENGMTIKSGQAYIAPGGFHMEVKREGNSVILRLNENPQENSCRPAVDVLFRSIATVYGKSTLGVILTGMGKDGCNGSEAISEKGGRILVQDEASSVVWGMPRQVANAGLADQVLSLKDLGPEISNSFNSLVSTTI